MDERLDQPHDTLVNSTWLVRDTQTSPIRQRADLSSAHDRFMTSVFVTGAAGFIGAHLICELARRGFCVAGCDHFDPASSGELQAARVRALLNPVGLMPLRLDVNETERLVSTLRARRVETLIHLAALPGVRASSQRPLAYAQANLQGFASVLEASRQAGVQRVFYASSSSVYGNRGGQFAESDRTGPPSSFYAATKMANESMALAYKAQMGLSSVGLRLFTVYGPWGRPDMAPYLFAQAIRKGLPLRLFGHGQPQRDFTYISDVVDAITRLVQQPLNVPLPEILNIGHHQPVRIRDFVHAIEAIVGRAALIELHPLPPDDVGHTCADDRLLTRVIGPLQRTALQDGLLALVHWLQSFDPVDACQPAATS
jgi:UDP-glucuronate 4-epimerase